MLLLVPLVIGVGIGLAAGGRLGAWTEVRFRWPGVVVAALVVRVAVAPTPLGAIDQMRYVYAAFLIVLLMWTLWHVDRLPGVWLVAAGAGLNLLVVALNDFRMPVAATSASMLALTGHWGEYALMDAGTRLSWLGDWISVPMWLGGAYSPGDVVIGVGIGVTSFLITRRGAARTKLDATKTGIGS